MLFYVIAFILWVISWQRNLFGQYKISLILKKHLKWNLRCFAQFMITLAWKFIFMILSLTICEMKLVLLIFDEIVLLCRLVYYFMIDYRSAKIIDRVKYVWWRIDETSNKRRISFGNMDNIIAKVYRPVIYKRYNLLPNVKHNIKFMDVFVCWYSKNSAASIAAFRLWVLRAEK